MSKRRRKRRKRNANKTPAPSTSTSEAVPPKSPARESAPNEAHDPAARAAATTAPKRSGAAGEVVVEARARTSEPVKASPQPAKAGSRKQRGRRTREPIVPWRDRLRSLLEHVRAAARAQSGPALEAFLTERLGPRAQHEDAHLESDRARAIDAFACLPGSAGGEQSLVRRLAEEAGALEPADRDQLLRWETERRQDVFLLQRAHPDRLEAWDPVEGAGLTLHLLDRIGAGQAAQLVRGTVLTCAYLPYMARLVALPPVEFYAGAEPLGLYREQVKEAGRRWHDAPAPAPTAGSSGAR